MRTAILAAVASLAVLAWILTQTPTTDAQVGQITVTVLDYHGNPLPDAYVCLRNATGCYQARTDSNGRATFSPSIKSTLTYNLNITYLGIMNVRKFDDWDYSNPTHPKTFTTGVFNVKICALSSGGVQSVPNVRVEVRSTLTEPDVNVEQSTGGDGCVTFPRLPGNGTLYVYNATYVHPVFGVRIATGETNLNLDTDSYDNNNITLPLYRLRLTLRDRGDRPVQGLETRLWRGEKTGDPQMTATSDSAGGVVFSLLPEGRYIYEVVYKGDIIFATTSPENINANRDRPPIRLPLTRLTIEVYDLKNKPLTAYTAPGYELLARLYADTRLYFETRERGGVISAGYVYDEKDYRLVLLFEDQEVFSGALRPDDVKTGIVKVQARFGDFSLSLDSSGFFGNLPRILQRASIRLEAGNYRIEERLGGEGAVILRDKPLVRYSYTIILDGINIGSGELTPSHGEPRQLRPASHTVSVRISSLDERPIAGSLKISYGGEALGTVNIPREGGSIEGLARLPYRYSFTYMGTEVAVGEVRGEDIQAGVVNIIAAVADVRAKIFDNAGEEPLTGAMATLAIASYRQDSLVNEEGLALFPDAPLTTVTITVNYQGVKVYSSTVTYSPEQRLLEIKGTGVYTLTFKILDGEGEPLTDSEFRLSVGALSVSETLRGTGEITLKLIPNGTLSLSVNYMGVNVFTGSHRPLRYGEVVELDAKVYRLQVEVRARGREGPELLRGAQLLFDREERRLAEVNAAGGAASLKLPAGNYLVQVNYKGVPVADRVVALTGAQKISIEASAYWLAVKVLGFDGSPAANLTVKLLREGSDAPIEELTTDREGRASTILPEGVYNVVYGGGGVFNTVRLPVRSVFSWTLLYGETRANNIYPLVAAPALAGLSIYGLINSFRLKSKVRRIWTQRQERAARAEPERRPRQRLRKNV
ncbi:MAG: hypothetical protein RMJ28_06710 [Nitrososphaerota archaeon]|nr:hypothetical protein [Candidatus Calditenuaceae archaeon]MDW8073905.1 hypothetical protein [Nitrososphaerota archaeon]